MIFTISCMSLVQMTVHVLSYSVVSSKKNHNFSISNPIETASQEDNSLIYKFII